MRDTITIELSVVDAANLEDYLLTTMEAIDKRANERGHLHTNENRFVQMATRRGKQTQVTDDEFEYADMVNEADDNAHKNQN